MALSQHAIDYKAKLAADTLADTKVTKEKLDAEMASSTLLDKCYTALKKASDLRAKIINGTATEEDKKNYFIAKTEFANADGELEASKKIDSERAKQIKEDLRLTKLSRLTAKQGTISFVKPGDLFEYVLRTQALNPYSRERACDIEFMSLMFSVATDTNKDLAKVKELLALVKDSISGN